MTKRISRLPVDTASSVTTPEIRKLSDLLEVSQTLGSTLNLKSALARVLEILEEHHGTLSGAVALLDPDTGELAIEAAGGRRLAEGAAAPATGRAKASPAAWWRAASRSWCPRSAASRSSSTARAS